MTILNWQRFHCVVLSHHRAILESEKSWHEHLKCVCLCACLVYPLGSALGSFDRLFFPMLESSPAENARQKVVGSFAGTI